MEMRHYIYDFDDPVTPGFCPFDKLYNGTQA